MRRIFRLSRLLRLRRHRNPHPKHPEHVFANPTAAQSNWSTSTHHDPHHQHRLQERNKLSHPTHCRELTSDAVVGIKEWERFIQDNTEVSRDHLTPEITLRLITPRCRLWSVPYAECEGAGVSDPYWAFYWPGGQALSRFLLDNADIVAGWTVLEIGSGCGASAIGCVMAGAARVMANDIDPVSIQAIKMNAALNGVTVETSTDNLIGHHITNWDVILLGDMFYDQDFTNTVS